MLAIFKLPAAPPGDGRRSSSATREVCYRRNTFMGGDGVENEPAVMVEFSQDTTYTQLKK